MLAAESVSIPEWIAGPAATATLALAVWFVKLLVDLSRAVSVLAKQVDTIEDRFKDLADGQSEIHKRINDIAGWNPPAAERR